MNPINEEEDGPASYYHDFDEHLGVGVGVGNPPRRCSCQGPEEALCPCCVEDALRPSLERQRIALEERNDRREWCRTRLSEIEGGRRRRWEREQASRNQHGDGDRLVGINGGPPDLGRLNFEVDALRRKLAALRHARNTAAIRRDQLAVANDAREAEYVRVRSRLDGAAQCLQTLYVGDDRGGVGILPMLEVAERDANDSNRRRRMRLALRAFDMHRVDCGPENVDAFSAMMRGEGLDDGYEEELDGEVRGEGARSNREGHRHLSRRRRRMRSSPGGIGKIGGLPLPHAGPALYGALPPGGLTSALRLIGSLTSVLSMVLGVSPLPHPILLRPHPPAATAGEGGDDWEDVGGVGVGGRDGMSDVADIATFRRQQREDLARTGRVSSATPLRGTAGDASPSSLAVVPRVTGPPTTASVPVPTAPMSSWSIRGAAAATLSLAGRAILSTTVGAGAAGDALRSPSSGGWGGGERRLTSEEAADREYARRAVRHATALVIRERPVPTSTSRRSSTGGSSGGAVGGTGGLSTEVAEFELNLPPDGVASTDEDGDGDDEIRRRRVEEFQVGLQLLQNDVVALCVRAGVPVGTLWPAEAILLNLCSLRVFCRRQLLLMGDEIGGGAKQTHGDG